MLVKSFTYLDCAVKTTQSVISANHLGFNSSILASVDVVAEFIYSFHALYVIALNKSKLYILKFVKDM